MNPTQVFTTQEQVLNPFFNQTTYFLQVDGTVGSTYVQIPFGVTVQNANGGPCSIFADITPYYKGTSSFNVTSLRLDFNSLTTGLLLSVPILMQGRFSYGTEDQETLTFWGNQLTQAACSDEDYVSQGLTGPSSTAAWYFPMIDSEIFTTDFSNFTPLSPELMLFAYSTFLIETPNPGALIASIRPGKRINFNFDTMTMSGTLSMVRDNLTTVPIGFGVGCMQV